MNKLYNLSLFLTICLIFLITSCATVPWYDKQVAFVNSPQYEQIRDDQSYPVTILANDANSDGFTDAWVLVKDREHYFLEFWQQHLINKKQPTAGFAKICTFPTANGSELQDFSLHHLLGKNPAQALLLTKEESPDEGEINAMVAAYLPTLSQPCQLIHRERLVTRTFLATNEGCRVLALPGYREGFFIEQLPSGQEVLVREGQPQWLTFKANNNVIELIVGREQAYLVPEKNGQLKAHSRNLDMIPRQKIIFRQTAAASWEISRQQNSPVNMVQLTWGCPEAGLNDQNSDAAQLILESSDREEKVTLPLGTLTATPEIAAIADLSGTDPREKYHHLIYLLKKPLQKEKYNLLFENRKDNAAPFCLREIALRGSR